MSDAPALFAEDGTPVSARLELEDASGPVSPRFAHRTHVVVVAGPAGITLAHDHRDARGHVKDEGPLPRAAYEALVADVLREAPLGGALDLAGDKRTNKGVVLCTLHVFVGDARASIEYLPSHRDEDDGDPRVRAVVAAFERACAAREARTAM